jgi:hypothetical protein
MLGDKTATGGDLYAKIGSQPKVFLVSAYLESTFNKTTFDLRDKAILTFDRNKADAIEIVTANRTLKFAKGGEDWRLTAPVEARPTSARWKPAGPRADGADEGHCRP